MTVPKQGSKYHAQVNPLYQVDWMNQASGKRIAATKRRVKFRFGFSDADAIRAGETGPACRGEEHDVDLVWSLTSGKRLVMMDGKEVHYSMGGKMTDSKFETCWSMEGGHLLKLVAHAAPPLFTHPGQEVFRQFDLLIDGRSFFDMHQIFELGMSKTKKNSRSTAVVVPRNKENSPYNNYYSSPSAEASQGFAQRPSYDREESYHYEPEVTKNPVPPTETPPPALDMLSATSSSSTAMTFDGLDDTPVIAAVPSPTAVVDSNDEFAPVETPKSFSDVSNMIMSAYSPQQQQQAPVPPHHQQQLVVSEQPYHYGATTNAPYYQPNQQAAPALASPEASAHQMNYYQQPSVAVAAVVEEPTSAPPAVPATTTLTMQPLSIQELEEQEAPATASPMDKAVRSLVNLDDICETLETPEQRKLQEKKDANQPYCSKPVPPSQADWTLGLKPRLGDIKQHAPPKEAPKKEIMRAHAFDPAAAQAGMMVVYGSSPPPQQQHQQLTAAGGHYYQAAHSQYMVHNHHQQPRMYA